MLAATLLALGSAALHAAWNFIVKTDADPATAAWAQQLVGALLSVPVLLAVGLPGTDAIPYLAASGLAHTTYLTALGRAYRHGDFSLAYPLARGSGAIVAAAGGVWFLDDALGVWAWLAIAVVVGGAALLPGRNVHRQAVAWALVTGVAIGAYTTFDSAGARATEAVPYVLTIGVVAAASMTVIGAASGRLGDLVLTVRQAPGRMLIAGACGVVAYGMVLAAARLAAVGYVATLRSASIVIGAALGWLVLREHLGRRRLVASIVISAGLALLVATRLAH